MGMSEIVSKRSSEALWTWTERKCLYLLQQKNTNTKTSLHQIQGFMLRNALDTNVNLFTKLIEKYSSLKKSEFGGNVLGGVSYARKVFDVMPERNDTFLGNAMIKAYVVLKQFSDVFRLFNDLRRDSAFSPDSFTFTSLAKSCGSTLAGREGEVVHGLVMKIGFSFDLYVSTSLVDLYAKIGEMSNARKVFDEMTTRTEVSFTALVGGYARCGDMENARMFFNLMPVKDVVACNAMLNAYVKNGDMESARDLFDQMMERNVVSWTSLVYGYCKNGDLSTAKLLFDEMPVKNLFTWNTMIGGYCQNKQPQKALEIFHNLQKNSSFEPDEVTIVSILPAIADLGALELGDWIHFYLKRNRFDRASNVSTALIDMYSKCGEVTKAMEIFNTIFTKEVVTWNAMINGFALNGRGTEALKLFSDMRIKGYHPNSVTMLGVLTACSHCGFIKQGTKWFNTMEKEFNIKPEIEHYGCMIDLLVKAGYLNEAEDLMNSMPYKANRIILSSYLNGCGVSKDCKRGENVSKKAIEMEPLNDGNYIMLRNLYAVEKRWKDVDEVKKLMYVNGVKKEVGCSVIEVDCVVWEFVAGDRLHPCWSLISCVLKQLLLEMRKVPGH